MEFKINELSSSEKEVEISYSYEEIKNDIDTEVRKQTKKIQMPGFRKGKVPVNMIKKMYGDSLEIEASEKVANSKFWDVAEENHLHPIGRPVLTDINFKSGDNFSFKVKYEILPNLEIKNYNGLDIEIPDMQVRDEDIQKEIEYILRSHAAQESAEVVGDDRNFIIDVELQRINEKDEPFEGSKPETMQLDLSNEKIQADIIENVKGKKIGEFFTFSFKDEHKHTNTAGNEEIISEEYKYKVVINGIEKIVIPELNEELIKTVTKEKASTEDELKEEIKKDISNYLVDRINNLTRGKLIDLIVKNNDFTPPETLVSNFLNELIDNEEKEAKQQGYKKIDRDEAANRLRKSAEFEVKWFLIKDAIRKKENITFDDNDLNELAAKESEKVGIPVDKLLNYYKSSNYGEKLVDQKVFDFLIANNNIKKVEPEKYSQNETEESK